MNKQTEDSQEQTKKCPKCGEDILATAKKCKHCQTDIRPWLDRNKGKTITFLILGFIVFLMIAVSNNDKAMNQMKEVGDETKARNERTGKLIDEKFPDEKEKLKAYNINEDVIMDDLRINVIKVSDLGKSINQSFGSPIKTQGKFIRVDFEIENMGTEAQYMGDMKIIDSKDREFSESENKYSILGNDANFLDKLNPNVKTNYSTVFDIAQDAENLKLKTNGFGLFNSNYALVELGI